MAFSLSSQNVAQYLLNSKLCTLQDVADLKLEPKHLKNFNLLVSLPNHQKLLVKQERRGQDGQTANEFLNEWQFHQLLQAFPELRGLAADVSEVVHFDEMNSIMVYDYLVDYEDLEVFYARQEYLFPTVIAASIGTLLAKLHRETLNRQACHEFITQTPEGKTRVVFGNPARPMERIGPEIFGLATPDHLKFFALYQRYDSLEAAIVKLSEHWQPCCVVHNDLKFNNILLHKEWAQHDPSSMLLNPGVVRLIDWERCGWGDPICDLASILSNYLLVWIGSMVVDSSIKLEESLRLARTPLELLQPSITTLTQTYLSDFPEILAHRQDFLVRLVQFTGLALLIQVRGRLEYQKMLGNTGICMLQVAKSLLCRPEQSVFSIFGMSEAELLNLSVAA
jgi:Phosphotransferase enzyme family